MRCGASSRAGDFSQWPESLGLAAIGDDQLTRRFGEIARQEYRAVGITRERFHLRPIWATEPRWSRITGTFGEDAQLAKRMVQEYVIGFQNGSTGLNRDSVITVVKHWVAYGAQLDGFDGHLAYGKYNVFPKNNFAYHIIPFTGAFSAKVAGVMPTYTIPRDVLLNGKRLEQVGAGFSRQLLTDELRGRYKFNGVIVSDWGITNDCTVPCAEGAPSGSAALSRAYRNALGGRGIRRELNASSRVSMRGWINSVVRTILRFWLNPCAVGS